MNEELLDAARTLWEWLPVHDADAPADMIFVLGNKSEALPAEVAALFNQGLAPLIVLSGGHGRLTQQDAVGEADRYLAALLALGIPEDAIIVERESANTGQNVQFSKKLLEDKGLHISKAIAVTTGMMSRRHRATLYKWWPSVTWYVHTPIPVPFDTRMARDNVEEFFSLMAGEVGRLQYYPALGFFDEVTVPEHIVQAKEVLLKAGYDKFAVTAS